MGCFVVPRVEDEKEDVSLVLSSEVNSWLFPILFVAFDASITLTGEMAENGVRNTKNPSQATEGGTHRAKRPRSSSDEYYEKPGEPMKNIMSHFDTIVSETVNDAMIDKKEKKYIPKVIFISELLKDEAVEKDRKFPDEIRVFLKKWSQHVTYKKAKDEAGPTKKIEWKQMIAAYTYDNHADFEVTATKWDAPSKDGRAPPQYVLLVKHGPITVAGVHLATINCSAKDDSPYLERVFKNLQKQCEQKKLSLMIGDFNLDVENANRLQVEVCGSLGHIPADKNIVPFSNAKDDKYYMGILCASRKMMDYVTDTLILQRSLLNDGKRRYFSDHPPIYTCVSLKLQE